MLEECTLPLTGAGVVSRIITELAVMDVLPEGRGLRVVELAEGVEFAQVQARSGAKLQLADKVGRF